MFSPLRNDAEGTVFYFGTLSTYVIVKAANKAAATREAYAQLAELFSARFERRFTPAMVRTEREATQEEIDLHNFYEGQI